jgi:RNA polymerase sigma factor (TIGR02999 family)
VTWLGFESRRTWLERAGLPPLTEERDLSDEHEITRILERVQRGESGAADELFRRVFDELHALARNHMRGQGPEHTLQPTALVHEAYLRLFRGVVEPAYQDRSHFLRAASRAMRCVLVDHAREKGRVKRTAPGERLPLDGLGELFEERAQDLVALDEALERLAAIDARAVEVVELRFFGGRTEDEIAEILDVSPRTVERDWQAARAWLHKELA